MAETVQEVPAQRALAAAYDTQIRPSSRPIKPRTIVPKTGEARLRASLTESAYDLEQFQAHGSTKSQTVLYLAYGSNLSIETFRGKRGIRPISLINVQVPALRLTFDLPGIPYSEPCFANSGPREAPKHTNKNGFSNEKEQLVSGRAHKTEYRKDRWHKGLIGVVYEVTAADFAHIIATEGGGTAYQDVLVDCYPFESDDPNTPVPQIPDSTSFKAHTLFAPTPSSDPKSRTLDERNVRPDSSYAQPSARYLGLITDGAAELQLPNEYQEWLHSIRPYRITTLRQRAGKALFLSIWLPVIAILFQLGKIFSDKKTGQAPVWLRNALEWAFRTVWKTYDNGFKDRFGDGERTLGDDPDDLVLDGNENHEDFKDGMIRI